jgi:hypothetical protein
MSVDMNLVATAGRARGARARLSWLVCLLACLAWSGAARADVKISKQASRHFKAGVQYLTSRDPGRFERAYSEFRAAYTDSPSWKILGNLGIAAEGLERDSEAIEAYRGYVEKGGKELSSAERSQFKADWERVELGSAAVTLRIDTDGAWIVDERATTDGKLIVNRYGPSPGSLELRLRAGHHRMHAELNGKDSDVWEFEARPGASSSHVFELQRPPPKPPAAPEPAAPPLRPASFDERADGSDDPVGARVLGYTSLGLGGAGAALGTVFLLQAFERRSEGDSAYQTCSASQAMGAVVPACETSRRKSREEGTARTRALVSYSAAGALLTTGIVLLVYAGASSPSEPESAALTPWVGPGQLGVAGRF